MANEPRSAPSQEPPLHDGPARLGRYVVLGHLASGGMAEVLLGRSDGIEGFARHVVLKRIRAELARDQRFIRMFLGEARVAATLHHQHIVQVYDVGEADGEYFIAMEYVHGQDVRQILATAARQRTHVPLAHAIAIVSAAAAGLHYAHGRLGADKQPLNIVHRDISPSNLLVGYDGSIKVVDFGVATASMFQETRSRSVNGKVAYMSPEQCIDDRVDRRSDVYALGVVLYELATTKRMISSESDYLTMEQIVHGRIPPPRARRPDLPDDLSAIIMRALATNRDDRYASADELRIALDHFASSAALTAPPSAIAAYMGQVFGHRLEPWLELHTLATAPDDDAPTVSGALGGSLPGHHGNEPARGTPLQPGGRLIASYEQGPALHVAGPPPADPDAPPGAPVLRRSAPRKVALLAVPLLVIAGGVLGLLGRGPRQHAPASTRITSRVPDASPPPTHDPGAAVSSAAIAAAKLPAAAASAPAAPGPAAPSSSRPDSQPSANLRPPRVAPPKRTAATKLEPPERSRKRTREATAAAPPSSPAASNSTLAMSAVVAPPPGATHAPEPPIASPAPDTQPANPGTTPRGSSPPPAPVVGSAIAPPRRVVIAAVLEANRTAGGNDIAPDDASRAEMRSAGRNAVVGAYKICVTADGKVETVGVLKTTGYPAYDAKIESTIFATWRYRPILVDGKPGPVCSGAKISWSTTAKLGNKPTWR